MLLELLWLSSMTMVMKMPQNDIVIDANVMTLFGKGGAAAYKNLFTWLRCCGGLCVSKAVLNEYSRQGSPLVASLVDLLLRERRCSSIKNSTIKAFGADSNYNYTCNHQDIPVARTVFRSFRKALISLDGNLRNDVNGFSLVNGIKPMAFVAPPASLLVANQGAICPKAKH